MGNKHSTLAEGDFETFSQNYAYIKKFNDTRFGDVKLLQERSTGAKIFQKDYISNTTKDFEKDLNEIKRRASVNHPNIIRIIGYTTKKEDAFCADYYKISVFYECYDYDLEHENFVRAQRKDRYPETELWYILDCIVTAGAHLEANEEAHGDIRPYNVLVSVNKEYKIVDNKLFNGGNLPSFYSLMNELENKGRYFSPEVFAFFGKKDKKEKFSHNKYKSDIFSLGLTLLECATLKNLDYLYNWETFEVNHAKIEEELRNLQSNKTYSPTLVETLRFMLNVDEEHRPNFLKLDSELSQYRADIKARVLKSEIETSAIPVININSNEQEEHHEYFDEEELDRRIRAAIEKSEETIRNSPAKHITENLNAYYDKFVSGHTPAAYETSNGTQAHSTHTRQPQQEKRSQPVASAYDGTTDYKSGSTTGAATTGAIGGYGNYGTTGASGASYNKPTTTAGTTGAYGGASTTVGGSYKPTSTGAIGGTTGGYTAGTYGTGKLSGDRTSPKNATGGVSGTTFGAGYGQPSAAGTYGARKLSGDRISPKNSTVGVTGTYGQTGATGSYTNGAYAARKVSGDRTSPNNTSVGATGGTFTSAYGQVGAGTTGGYTTGTYGAKKSVDRTSPKNSTIGVTGTTYGQVGAGTTTGAYGTRKVSGDRTSPKNATTASTTYGTTYGQTGTGYTPSTYGTTSATAGRSSPKNATSGTTGITYGATYGQPSTGATGSYTTGTYGATNLSGGRSSPKNATSGVTGTYSVSPVSNTTGTAATTYGTGATYGQAGTTTYGQTGATGAYTSSYGARPNATSTTGTTGATGSYTSGAKYTPDSYSYGGAVSTSKTAV